MWGRVPPSFFICGNWVVLASFVGETVVCSLIEWVWHCWQKSVGHRYMDFFVGFQFYSVGIYDRLSLASMSTSHWCLLCTVIDQLFSFPPQVLTSSCHLCSLNLLPWNVTVLTWHGGWAGIGWVASEDRVQIPASPLTNCMAWGKSFDFSVSLLPQLQNGKNETYFSR